MHLPQALQREPVKHGDVAVREVIEIGRRGEFSLLDAADDDLGEVITPGVDQFIEEPADIRLWGARAQASSHRIQAGSAGPVGR